MQSFERGSCDAVFATNVLHATRNMAATLQRCKALLRTGGLLLANELCARTDFLTLTFGLTDGWWLYDDAERRIPGSPLLSRYAKVLVFWFEVGQSMHAYTSRVLLGSSFKFHGQAALTVRLACHASCSMH